MDPNYLDLAPSPRSHIQTLTKIGYTFNSAVADIIDNSIAANAKNIWIQAEIIESRVRISISDDGDGMSKIDLISNMRIGCKDPLTERANGDLGRFGSGLKTASFSQAEVLTVISRIDGGEYSSAIWDIADIKRLDKWILRVLDDSEINEIVSSIENNKALRTIVIWDRLYKYVNAENELSVDFEDVLADQIYWLRRYLGLHFHKFIDGSRKLNLHINNERIPSLSPFMENQPGYWEGPKQSFKMRQKSGKVEIQVHNIPHPSKLTRLGKEHFDALGKITNGQGFYVYRNDRLIIAGGWLGLAQNTQLGRLARVEVNIPSSLDEYWTTDVKKSSIEIPHQVKNRLKTAINVPVKQSKRAYRYRGFAEKANEFWEIVENKSTGDVSYQISPKNNVLIDLLKDLDYSQKQKIMFYLKDLAINLPCHNIYHVMAEGKQNIVQDNEALEKALMEIIQNG